MNFNINEFQKQMPAKKIDKNEFLKQMFKLMLESLMEGERSALLGYSKYDPSGYHSGNSRNGYYQRDLLTGLGLLEKLNVPRDRQGEFFSQLLEKWQSSLKPMDELILSLYAKGMTTRDIEDIIKRLYGKDISPQYVSNITKEIEEERIAWQGRKLKPRYTAVFIDALFVKIRREVVSTDAVYVIAGIDDQGYRDILGLWIGAEESSRFWKQVLQDLKDRGVNQVLLFICDGLKNLEETINEIYPRALTQLCIVHQTRSTLNKVRPKHKEAVASDLKTIYKAKKLSEAKANALKLKKKWHTYYPKLIDRWIVNIESLMRFLDFPEYIRPHLYSTNWLERLNKEFRKVLKNKNSFPTESAVSNLIYLKIRDILRSRQTQRVNGFASHQIDIDVLWEKHYGKGGN